MSPTVLIVYQSSDGHTATVAHHIAKVMAGQRVGVTVESAEGAPPPAGFDAVVLGDSIHLGRHSRELADYAKSNQAQLTDLPVALFQVSLTSATEGEEAAAEATKMLQDFCDATDLEPERVGLFAGALTYTRHRGLERWLMRKIAADAGLDEDVDVDHVYTDWAAVESFATAAVRLARRAERPADGVASMVDFDVPMVGPTDTLQQVVRALVANDTGVVLVCSEDADPLCTESVGGVVGIVSERDVIDAIHDGADLSTVWAADVMSTRLISLPASRTVEEVATAMVDHHVRHVVVPGTAGRAGVVSMRSLIAQVATPA